MRNRSTLALLVGAITMLLVAALAGAGLAASGKKAAAGSTCLVTDVGGLNDRSFNQLAYQGLKTAQKNHKESVAAITSEQKAAAKALADAKKSADAKVKEVEKAASAERKAAEAAIALAQKTYAAAVAKADKLNAAAVKGAEKLAAQLEALEALPVVAAPKASKAKAPELEAA